MYYFYILREFLLIARKEYKDVYTEGVRLIANISTEISRQSIGGASAADNAMLIAVRELTAEVRACREVFMAVVSSQMVWDSTHL